MALEAEAVPGPWAAPYDDERIGDGFEFGRAD